jgi:hypothetical protein
MACDVMFSDNSPCLPPSGNTYEITIGEYDKLIVTVDYGERGKTKSIISPSGARLELGSKIIEQDFSTHPIE